MDKINKINLKVMSALILIIPLTTSNIYASDIANMGENLTKSVSEQLVWVGILVIVVGVVGQIVKRNWTAVITTIIFGSAITYIIGNPEVLKNIGDYMGEILGL